MQDRGRDHTTPASDTLSKRRDKPLSRRAHRVLGGVDARAKAWLGSHIDATLDTFEARLFELAQAARSSAAERDLLDGLNVARAQRESIACAFLDHARAQLSMLGNQADATEQAPAVGRQRLGLELMGREALDQSIVLAAVTARSETHCSSALFGLAHRLAVLAALPAFDIEELPLGPARLGAALRTSVSGAGLLAAQHIELYRCFERALVQHLPQLYAELNDGLVADGILPGLHLRASTPARAAAPQAGAEVPQPDEDATQPDNDRDASVDADRVAPAAAPPAASRGGNDALLDALSVILAERRRSRYSVTRNEGPAASLSQLQQVLTELQATSNVDAPAAPDAHTAMQYLQRDLLARLRHLDPQARTPRLEAQHADTIDLMSLLFEHLERDVASSNCRHLMTGAQAPLLRVALADRSFFTATDNPARRWLNSIAQAGSRWADVDAALAAQLKAMVARVNDEFDGNAAVFDAMRDDIERKVATLERKAQLAERRLIEASKGRERLYEARARAQQAVDERLADSHVDHLTKALLQRTWVDLLALTWLRDGEDSDAWREQLDVVDALTGRAEHATDQLQENLQQGLARIGVGDDDARSIARKVTSGDDEQDDEPVTRTELALKLKQRARVGADAGVSDEAPQPAPPASLSIAEQSALDTLKTTAFGTWFEIDEPGSDTPQRRKLAWYTRGSGRCLMVDQRGTRSAIDQLEALARSMADGRARVAGDPKDSLVDRAWHAIVGQLKAMAGRTAAEAAHD